MHVVRVVDRYLIDNKPTPGCHVERTAAFWLQILTKINNADFPIELTDHQQYHDMSSDNGGIKNEQ